MERGRRGGRLVTAVLISGALAGGVLAGGVLLLSGPVAAADDARPTVDPSAPTPTEPYAGQPPQGSAPDGSTVGGEDLDTRDVVVPDDAPDLPDGIAASGWLVADADSGAVLAARDPHGRYYPASTLKTLTLLTLAPVLDPDQVVEGTAGDERVEGSRVGLVQGGRYPVSFLFEALILQSGNDAANALARAAGGLEDTLAAMNETAEHLGAFDTVAGTPSGLDVAGQSSSPYDLALIFRALLDDPVTAAVLTTPVAHVPAVAGRSEGYQIQNQNPLLGSYEGNLGGKTGFTDAARHTFVTAAERDGRRLVVSVMDTESQPLRAAEQAALLLDWGFALPEDVEGVGRLVEPGEVAASSSSDRSGSIRDERMDSSGAAAGSTDEEPSPLVPAALAAGAVLIVGATIVGRRRAMRPVPVRRPTGQVPPRPGTAPGPRPPRDAASPSTRR